MLVQELHKLKINLVTVYVIVVNKIYQSINQMFYHHGVGKNNNNNNNSNNKYIHSLKYLYVQHRIN